MDKQEKLNFTPKPHAGKKYILIMNVLDFKSIF